MRSDKPQKCRTEGCLSEAVGGSPLCWECRDQALERVGYRPVVERAVQGVGSIIKRLTVKRVEPDPNTQTG